MEVPSNGWPRIEEPGAVRKDASAGDSAHDEQDEWEYEYSTTATETYYLTLELSYPEFKEAAPRVLTRTRGGQYKYTHEDGPSATVSGSRSGVAGLNTDKKTKDKGKGPQVPASSSSPPPPPHPSPSPVPNEDLPTVTEQPDPDIDPMLLMPDEEPGESSRQGQTDMDEPQNDPLNDGEGPEEPEEPPQEVLEREEIQVLELHSRNPVISYRGRVFEGSWAEVIGTETIFADRNECGPLPALRNLEDNVDLLAASCARILTEEKTLKPKEPEHDPLAAIKEEWNIRIPRGRFRAPEKAAQAQFLENLMALKIKKGETDHVTVYAKDGLGKDFLDDPNRRPRRKRQTLREDEGTDAEAPRERTARPRYSRAGRSRAGRNARRRAHQVADLSQGGPQSVPDAVQGEGLSMPTPSRWGDLFGDGESEGDAEEEDPEESSGEDVTMTGT